jgi:hypothetical protein
MMMAISWKRYRFVFSKGFGKILLIQTILCIICFFVVYLKGYPFAYAGGTILFVVSLIYSVKRLDDRIKLKEIIKDKMKKNKK